VQRYESAEVFLPEGQTICAMADAVNGKYFPVESNPVGYDGFMLLFDGDAGEVVLKRGDVDEHIKFGMGHHVDGVAPWQRLAKEYQFFGKFTFLSEPNPWVTRCECGSGAVWVNEQTLVIRIHMLNFLQSFTMTLYFGTDAAVLHLFLDGTFDYNGLPMVLTHKMK